MRARGVQPDRRHDDAERARPQHADAAPAHRIGKALGRTDHHRSECAFCCQRSQGRRHGIRWRRKHREVRGSRQGSDVRPVIGIERDDRALEAARMQVCHHLPALGRAGADHGDGFRVEQAGGAETAGRPQVHQWHGWNQHKAVRRSGINRPYRPRGRICHDEYDGVAWRRNGQGGGQCATGRAGIQRCWPIRQRPRRSRPSIRR